MNPCNKLVEKIEYAFSDVTNINGTTMSDCIIADGFGDEDSRKSAVGKDERNNWKNIKSEWIEQFSSVFCFANSIGAKFFIAPYMIWVVRNAKTSNSTTSDFVIYFLDRIDNNSAFLELLNNDQRSAIRDFLIFMKNQMPAYCDKDAVISAYRKWKSV